ncbi:MAG: phosphatidylserine decarboxylase family protein [Deltaproteobacteria bacterium]|jgi:phosphatidylserine decarboxylase|nr:phosphatidylserine decarboxylase family protein [Deltaproteobacteria bacterium]
MLEDIFKANIPHYNLNNTLPVARPGLIFIVIGLAVTLLAWLLCFDVAAFIFLLLTLFTIYFFRDPNRPTPPEGFGLSPCDGQVIRIQGDALCPISGRRSIKVSVFMNLFSVHVNRLPVSGRLVSQEYHAGKFLNASFDKASDSNERNALLIEASDGTQITVVQIAGLIARRVVSWVKVGQDLTRGERFGMIRFGSRVDLYLPEDSQIMVALGQKVSAGWSPIWRNAAKSGR